MSKEEKRMNKRGTSCWSSIPFMIRMAWTNRRPIIIFAVLIVLMTAGQRIMELLVSPMILSAVETKAGIHYTPNIRYFNHESEYSVNIRYGERFNTYGYLLSVGSIRNMI